MRRAAYKKKVLKNVVWIYTEGTKTEPRYFESMLDDLGLKGRVEIGGTGYNTDSLVEQARNKLHKDGEVVDYIWCVMDRDSFKKQNFNRAFELTEGEEYKNKDGDRKIKIAYSNEAFELWYVLHYEYLSSETSRKKYAGILSKHLNREYKKNSLDVYHQIKDKQETAIKYAKKLRTSYSSTNPNGRHNPEQDNPSTNVDELVEFLKKLASK